MSCARHPWCGNLIAHPPFWRWPFTWTLLGEGRRWCSRLCRRGFVDRKARNWDAAIDRKYMAKAPRAADKRAN